MRSARNSAARKRFASPDRSRRQVPLGGAWRCLTGKLEPVMGRALLAEYGSVMARSEPFGGSPVSAGERAALASRCRWVRVFYLWRPNLPDEADNHVIELAVAAGAEAIATHNTRDFERAELHFPGLRVLTPAELIAEDRIMSTLTVRLPDDTHERLKELARHRGVSVNKLME